MVMNCLECNAQLSVPQDAINGEVVSCKECGAPYMVVVDNTGTLSVQPLEVEEDWGE